MAEYTYNEMMKMQNDAIRRAEEMQKRARKTVGIEKNNEKEEKPEITREEPRRISMPNDYLENLKQFAANSSHKENEEKFYEKKTKKIKSSEKNSVKENPFGDLNLDEDKALLLALILLLSEEGADELLIMALIYMLT